MADWTQAERRAWAWPDKQTPSQWAEEHRVLPSHVTAEPGPWRNARTPYLVGVMDAVVDATVEEIVFCKAAQVGFSEAIRNILGYWIDRDPGPCLLVTPDQKSAEELIEERIKPLLEFTPAIARHVSSRAWDVKKSAIRLDTMSIYVGWAGSSQALKSRPIRYLALDEVDEYPPISGSGGDPISKAMKRVTTYAAKGRAKVIIGGTPTTRLGNLHKHLESCGDQRHYWVPCPHCGRYQKLAWKQIKWEAANGGETRSQHAARILDTGAAWHQCENKDCGGKIVEDQKNAMMQRGVWAGMDQVVTADGRVIGPARKPRKVGFHMPAMYSPWVSFSRMAAEWLEAQDDVQALADFINQRLAEPFEEQRAKTEPNFITNKAKGGGAAGIIPKWAKVLIATADTQGNNEQDGYFWYTIRAWGYDYRSQLVDFGVASSKGELIERTLDRQFQVEGGGMGVARGLWVDSGGPRWSEVYQMAQADQRIHPVKGSAQKRTWMVDERPQKKHGVVLWEVDTEQSKDLLHRLMHDPDATRWLPHSSVNEDYCRQLCSESKIFNPSTRREEWVEIVKKNNHLWDCEHYQAAVAWRLGCGTPEPVAPVTNATDGEQSISADQWMSRGNRW